MAKQYVELGTLLVAFVAFWLLLVFIQNPIALLINSLIAFIILLALNMIFKVGISINIFTILIVAIGGMIGLVLILLLRLANVAFHTE